MRVRHRFTSTNESGEDWPADQTAARQARHQEGLNNEDHQNEFSAAEVDGKSEVALFCHKEPALSSKDETDSFHWVSLM